MVETTAVKLVSGMVVLMDLMKVAQSEYRWDATMVE